ncbi:sodium-dependent bicarbonate transport family permease [Peptococcaceae bacterium]|nr:sodium-dependent bicarbonate transport family permease [Peptococcaceae bacterium]
MDILMNFLTGVLNQLQAPVLAFLIAGMLVAAFNSKLRIPEQIHQFCIFMLLMAIGLEGGIAIRESNFMEIFLPALFCVFLGIGIVLLGSVTLARLPGIKKDDALATTGLFGAVSGSTLAAGMVLLEDEGVSFEAWVPALYPFMDIPALITAVILANIYLAKQKQGGSAKISVSAIAKDCLRGTALTVLLMGVVLGLITKPDRVFEEFFDPLFRGFLAILMLASGMEAYRRLKELKGVAHWYAAYAFLGPLTHGLMGFALGYVAYLLVGLSPGGVIMMAVIAASNSDISGPPTVRAGIPSANPSVYHGTSTGLGTTVVIALYLPLFYTLGKIVFGI